MSVSYKKLWVMLIQKDLKKADLREMAQISPSTMSKMNRNEYVALEILVKICKQLNCNIGDIVDVIHDEN